MSYLSSSIRSTLSQRYGNSRCRIAVVSSHGRRQTMEDAHFVKMQRSSKRVCIGVLDGHGGDWVANEGASILPEELFKRRPEQAAAAYLATDERLRALVDSKLDASLLETRRTLCLELGKWERCWLRMQSRWRAYHVRSEWLCDLEYAWNVDPLRPYTYIFRRAREIQSKLADAAYAKKYSHQQRPQPAFSARKMESVGWGKMERDQEEQSDEARQTNHTQLAPYKRAAEVYKEHIRAYQADSLNVCDTIRSLRERIKQTYQKTELSGSTVAVCDIEWARAESQPTVTLSHAGDSRAIVYSRDGNVLYYTQDHKPEDARERARIEAAGSSVQRSEYNVLRVNGNLNMSRAIGDFEDKWCHHRPAEEQAITCLPDVQSRLPLETGDFIVVCCDGLFECNQFTNESLGKEIVSTKGWASDPDVTARRILAKCALRPTHDNQTLAIVTFGKPGDTYGTGRAVYTPMAVQEPQKAFSARSKSYYPTLCFVDVLTKELEEHGFSLRSGILRGFALEPPSSPEAQELFDLVHRTPASELASALLERYKPSSLW